jgi:hypothetical protein
MNTSARIVSTRKNYVINATNRRRRKRAASAHQFNIVARLDHAIVPELGDERRRVA